MMMWLRLEPLSQPELLIVVMRLLCSLPSSHWRFNQRSNELRFEPRRVVVRILAHLLDAVGSNRLLAGVPGRKIEAMTKVAEALLADALRLSQRSELSWLPNCWQAWMALQIPTPKLHGPLRSSGASMPSRPAPPRWNRGRTPSAASRKTFSGGEAPSDQQSGLDRIRRSRYWQNR